MMRSGPQQDLVEYSTGVAPRLMFEPARRPDFARALGTLGLDLPLTGRSDRVIARTMEGASRLSSSACDEPCSDMVGRK